MVRVYTDEWNGFQFRAPVYLDGHFEPYKFDLVKWEDHKPHEVIDIYTGKKKMSTRSCFTVGTLIWNPKEPCFDFHSCGLRYLEYRIDGLEKFILDFCETMERQLSGAEEYNNNNDERTSYFKSASVANNIPNDSRFHRIWRRDNAACMVCEPVGAGDLNSWNSGCGRGIQDGDVV